MEVAEAKRLVEAEVNKFLGTGWQVRYFKAARLYGQCRQTAMQNLIRINELFLQQCSQEQVLQLVRHEIAHGLAGRRHGHDAHFAKVCSLIGAPASSRTRIDIKVPFKFKLTCISCGKVYHKYTHKRMWRCGVCRGRLAVERFNNQEQVTTNSGKTDIASNG